MAYYNCCVPSCNNRQSSHLVPGHGARVWYSLGTYVNTPFYSSTHTRIRARCRYPLVLGLKSGHWVSVCTTVLLVLGQSTSLYSLSSNFKMASDTVKWSNYVYSYMSGTQGVNTTPFCDGTQALVPGRKVWTAPI